MEKKKSTGDAPCQAYDSPFQLSAQVTGDPPCLDLPRLRRKALRPRRTSGPWPQVHPWESWCRRLLFEGFFKGPKIEIIYNIYYNIIYRCYVPEVSWYRIRAPLLPTLCEQTCRMDTPVGNDVSVNIFWIACDSITNLSLNNNAYWSHWQLIL